MFSVPKSQPSSELIAWWLVGVDRRSAAVTVKYGAFADQSHLLDPGQRPLRSVANIQITGDTAQPLLATEDNRLYDDTRALIGRLLTGQATAQEQADVSGWQELAQAIAVEGVEHMDSDPFDLPGGGE